VRHERTRRWTAKVTSRPKRRRLEAPDR
jgi:hypothetical protein